MLHAYTKTGLIFKLKTYGKPRHMFMHFCFKGLLEDYE